MDKITYLAELAEGLARWVPERERQDILRYYAEYFDEAGIEREAEVVAELGDPWALSCRLAVEGGYVTQDAANNWTPRQNRRKVWPVVAVAAVACVAIAAVSVVSFVSGIGRLVGRAADRSLDQVTAVAEPYYEFGFIPQDEQVVYFEEWGLTGGFWSMEDGTLDRFTAIDAEISVGDIFICGGEDHTLSISYGGGCELDWEVINGTLKIRDGGGNGCFGLDRLGAVMEGTAADVSITVPYGEHLDKLAVRTETGDVYLSELSVEGDVSAESETGDVECYEVQAAKKLRLTADVGDVMLGIESMYPGMEMELESDVGQVEASLGCWETECTYQVKTDVGTVIINGRERGTKAEHKVNDAACKLDVKSDVGDVNVWFYNDQWNH